MAEQGRRKRSKKAYIQNAKKQHHARELCVGERGIIVTCNNQERQCVADAYNLLNEYGTELYGEESLPAAAPGESPASSDNEEDIDKALEQEVAALKQAGKKNQRRFQVIRSGANNVLFIRCRSEVDPYQLVHHILADALKTRVQKSRFCQRILPVTDTAYASMEGITAQAKRVLAPHFHKPACKEPTTFAVVYKARNQGSLKRDDVIKVVADVAIEGGIVHKVDLTKPQLVISVEVIKNVCCMVVLEDFYKFKRYNILSVVTEDATAQDSTSSAAAAKEETSAATSLKEGNSSTTSPDESSSKAEDSTNQTASNKTEQK